MRYFQNIIRHTIRCVLCEIGVVKVTNTPLGEYYLKPENVLANDWLNRVTRVTKQCFTILYLLINEMKWFLHTFNIMVKFIKIIHKKFTTRA